MPVEQHADATSLTRFFSAQRLQDASREGMSNSPSKVKLEQALIENSSWKIDQFAQYFQVPWVVEWGTSWFCSSFCIFVHFATAILD